jgi:hypothetical protein
LRPSRVNSIVNNILGLNFIGVFGRHQRSLGPRENFRLHHQSLA